jgi:hypothetical protein
MKDKRTCEELYARQWDKPVAKKIPKPQKRMSRAEMLSAIQITKLDEIAGLLKEAQNDD